jgi:hypothetical protein
MCLLFISLWIYRTIQSIATFVIAEVCCKWYYSHSPTAQSDLSIIRSYKMAFRFHLGSLALVSLFFSIVQSLLFFIFYKCILLVSFLITTYLRIWFNRSKNSIIRCRLTGQSQLSRLSKWCWIGMWHSW